MTGKKRNVAFSFDEALVAQVVCYIPMRDEIEPELLQELYYKREEFQAQRIAAKADSRESGQTGVSKNLDDVFSEKCKNAQESLNNWTSKGEAARGLERWANREHGEKRQQDQFSAIMAVLQAQDDMLYSKMPVDHSALRKVSYKATRSARHFARMLGKADAFAVGIDIRGSDVSSLAGMSALSLDSRRTFPSSDDCSLAPSVSHQTDITIPSSMASLPSLDDDSLDIDLPKKSKDGKRRFNFLRRKSKKTPEMVGVHSRS